MEEDGIASVNLSNQKIGKLTTFADNFFDFVTTTVNLRFTVDGKDSSVSTNFVRVTIFHVLFLREISDEKVGFDI